MDSKTTQLIEVGQIYRFDTIMLLDRLPGIRPELIRLTVTAVSYENETIQLEPSPYDNSIEYIDASLAATIDWFKNELPKLPTNTSVFQAPSDFENFVRRKDAELLST